MHALLEFIYVVCEDYLYHCSGGKEAGNVVINGGAMELT